MAELKDFAIIAADSNFFGAKTPQQAMMIAMAGRDLGFSYTQSLRAFHVIKDKPSLSADGMVAACLQHRELCEFFRPVEQTSAKSTWETKRVGDDAVRRFTFTMDDAKAAKLPEQNGGMWQKYPQRMLSARAKAFLARDVYPELLMGLYDPEELGEIPAPPVRAHVESRIVESTSFAGSGVGNASSNDEAADLEIDELESRMDDAKTEDELKAVGRDFANRKMSEDQRKYLRGYYAKRRNKIAKLARDANGNGAPPDSGPPTNDAPSMDARPDFE